MLFELWQLHVLMWIVYDLVELLRYDETKDVPRKLKVDEGNQVSVCSSYFDRKVTRTLTKKKKKNVQLKFELK